MTTAEEREWSERLRAAFHDDGWLAEARLSLADRAALVERAERAETAHGAAVEDHRALAAVIAGEARRLGLVLRLPDAVREMGRLAADRDAQETARVMVNAEAQRVVAVVTADRDRLAAELEAIRGSGGVLTWEECARLLVPPHGEVPDPIEVDAATAGVREQHARDVAVVRSHARRYQTTTSPTLVEWEALLHDLGSPDEPLDYVDRMKADQLRTALIESTQQRDAARAEVEAVRARARWAGQNTIAAIRAAIAAVRASGAAPTPVQSPGAPPCDCVQRLRVLEREAEQSEAEILAERVVGLPIQASTRTTTVRRCIAAIAAVDCDRTWAHVDAERAPLPEVPEDMRRGVADGALGSTACLLVALVDALRAREVRP